MEDLETRFRDFLVSKQDLLSQIQEASDSNKETVFIDLEEMKPSHSTLFVNLHQNFIQKYEQVNKVFKEFCISKINKPLDVGFMNAARKLKIRDLKSDVLGDLISFSGTVTRTTQVRPELQNAVFKCRDCGTVISNVKQEFTYTEPLFCPNHLCSNRSKFEIDITQSTFNNWQRVHVQEKADEIPNGCLPRSIDVIVRNELVEQIKPGSNLNFTGYLMVIPDIVQLKLPNLKSIPVAQGVADEKQKRGSNSKELNYKMSFFCIHADVDVEKEGFTSEELSIIRRMMATPDLYSKLSESLFPTIHGHSNIKSAILLMLVGGVSKSKDIKLRGDINILLVGDPGTAKSQFLKQTSTFNSRSIYTSGKSSSAAGLTAAVIKDGETGEFTIEAGALMLSDQGVCCIDEFDKMNYKDQVSIHEAMEQQTITISKAGINATLNSRTSILAAANPVRGRYDKRKTLKQNVNLSPPIMSRFDLYFVLIDDVDAEHDRNVSRHILQNHLSYNEANSGESRGLPAQVHPFTVDEVKLYIKYVKDKETTLTEASRKELVEKYNQLRQDSLVNTNNYRMTVRNLESMVRLSESLAKIHNDPEVNTSYILEAFRLIKSSLVEIRGEDIVLTCKNTMETNTLASKDISKITSSLIYLIKSSTGLTRERLVGKYCEMIEDTLENVEMFQNEKVKCEMVIDFLIENEGILFEVDDVLHIHPNYDY